MFGDFFGFMPFRYLPYPGRLFSGDVDNVKDMVDKPHILVPTATTGRSVFFSSRRTF